MMRYGWIVLMLFIAPVRPVDAATEKAKAKPARQVQQQKKSPAATAKPTPKPPQSELEKAFDSAPASGDAPPVFIRSATVSLNAKERVFVYRDNVEITRGDLNITADIVTGRYNAAGEMETVICEQNVVITKGENMKSSSNRAVYNVKAGTVVLTEGPELNDRGNVLSADKVTMFVNEDRSEAEGNVRVKVTRSEGGGGLTELGGNR